MLGEASTFNFRHFSALPNYLILHHQIPGQEEEEDGSFQDVNHRYGDTDGNLDHLSSGQKTAKEEGYYHYYQWIGPGQPGHQDGGIP